MDSGKFLSVNLLVILMLSIALSGVNSTIAQTDDVTSKMQAANKAIKQSFNAVSTAEEAGANAKDLLNQLNFALTLFAQAQNALRIGDDNITLKDANAVLTITQQVITQAQDEKESAALTKQNSFLSTITLAVIGSFVLVLVLLLIWRRFKTGYFNNLIESKPEVNKQ